MAGAGLATVSLASDEQDATRFSDQVAAASLQPLPEPKPSSSFAAPAPVYVAPPQARVALGPLILSQHTPPPPPCVDDPAHPLFCVYTVQPGDTLSGIAELYRLGGNEHLSAVEMLAQSNKPDVISSDEIVPGQQLRLPKRTGIVHTAFSTRTLGEVVALYGVTVEAVTAVPENGIAADGQIQVGQDILIPDPQHLPPEVEPELPPLPEPTEEGQTPEAAPEQDEPAPTVEPPPIETPEPAETPEPEATPEPEDTPEPEEDEQEAEDEAEEEQDEDEDVIIVSDLGDRPSDPSVYGFVWPVWGQISSYFDAGHPLGIDIDMYDDPHSPVGSAKAGIVTFAGGDACCSYGLYVIVEHGDGTSTLYAHLSQIAVSQGQVVSTGQLVGFAGATGYATGNHLHFEVRIGDHVVDPLIFLPPQ
jgi:murein DD-endopeptidase MepM/ murein hydrolase activator NlpD